jgi:phosphohistidine swiveling domain-containing protein
LIQFLHTITDEPVGGKAMGLKMLQQLGLRVPDSFVIVHPNGGEIPEEMLQEHLQRLGNGPKAVRSSAVSEDGFHASFAGQFETFLNVTGQPEILEAIRKCVSAAYSGRIASYSASIHHKADTRISVIVQNMVNAAKAGVIFTADPVTNRRDKMVIDVVPGAGDALVSGHLDGVAYHLYRSGKNIDSQITRHGDLLSAAQIRELMDGARKAEKAYGCPVDMEWAAEEDGTIHWLQVRPVTTLDDVHFNELDDVKGESTDVWSLGNISEMMPGVVTPLTYSISGRAIDMGLGYLAARSGLIRMKDYKEFRSLQMFYNRLFFNMTKYMGYVERLAFNRKENILVTLSAQDIPELGDPRPGPFLPGFFRFLKQNLSILGAVRHVVKLDHLARGFQVITTGNLDTDYVALDKAFQKLTEAFCHHNLSSAQSGYYFSVLMGILTRNRRPASSADHYFYTLLVSDTPGIESADAVRSLERFAEVIRESPEFASEFLHCSPQDAIEYLELHGPWNIRDEYRTFLMRHGHRCVRESELREKPWEEDQVQLMSMVQATVRAGRPESRKQPDAGVLERQLSVLSGTQRFFIRMLRPRIRKAVVRREQTKSASIKMVHEIRKAYRRYGESLVAAGLLEDPDQVFFLTHAEHARLLEDRDPSWKEKARKRRIQLPETARLNFDLMHAGIPEPQEEEDDPLPDSDQLKGIPVSSGIAEGTARIVNTLEEASGLVKGEIMVVSFTDIGWTPYFSLISGLVTEIGSPLSHGAVVAREYGIPAVVSAKGARSYIQTGDRIRINGNTGAIEIIEVNS